MGIANIPEVVSAFYRKRDRLKIEITEHESQVRQHNVDMARLERELMKSRPLLDGCFDLQTCNSCDVYSLKLDRTVPQQGEEQKVYRCIICNKEQSYM